MLNIRKKKESVVVIIIILFSNYLLWISAITLLALISRICCHLISIRPSLSLEYLIDVSPNLLLLFFLESLQLFLYFILLHFFEQGASIRDLVSSHFAITNLASTIRAFLSFTSTKYYVIIILWSLGHNQLTILALFRFHFTILLVLIQNHLLAFKIITEFAHNLYLITL